jgi:hypothetical protein
MARSDVAAYRISEFAAVSAGRRWPDEYVATACLLETQGLVTVRV